MTRDKRGESGNLLASATTTPPTAADPITLIVENIVDTHHLPLPGLVPSTFTPRDVLLGLWPLAGTSSAWTLARAG
jgi:hypothetical protein